MRISLSHALLTVRDHRLPFRSVAFRSPRYCDALHRSKQNCAQLFAHPVSRPQL